MKIRSVQTEEDKVLFVKFPIQIYDTDDHWIRPIDQDVEDVFDLTKNLLHLNGKSQRWLLIEDENVIGRIAAYINFSAWESKNSEGQNLKVGGMGFFECIENQEAANLLFDTAGKWLEELGCNCYDGPINFGDRDNWWGVLAAGFDIDPNYKMPWTKKYYLDLFENYGFQLYFKQITYGRKVAAPLHPTYEKVSQRLFDNPDYEFRILDVKQLEKFAEDFCTIFNAGWAEFEGVKELKYEEALSRFKELKQIVDPEIVYFAYFKGEPVSFFINIPELNQSFKHIKNGKLNLIGKLKLLWNLKIAKKNDKMMGLVFGVVPDQQRKGVMIAIVEYCRRYVQDKFPGRYIDFEMNWVGDFNPKMMKVASGIGDPIKIHHTYRYMIDKSLTFERCPEV